MQPDVYEPILVSVDFNGLARPKVWFEYAPDAGWMARHVIENADPEILSFDGDHLDIICENGHAVYTIEEQTPDKLGGRLTFWEPFLS